MVDLSFLETFTKGDTKKMQRYIRLYLDVVPYTFEKMQQNINDNDWEQLRINAHSLKPQADFMGISELKILLIEIEDAVKDNNLDNISEQFRLAKETSILSSNKLSIFLNELK